MKHNRKVTDQQVESLIDNIRKIHIANEGLSKKDVVERAFTETFGGDKWPILAVSSTIARYWKMAFPSESSKVFKKKRYWSRQSKATPVAVIPTVDQSNTQIHMCPRCHCRFAVTIFEG